MAIHKALADGGLTKQWKTAYERDRSGAVLSVSKRFG
jgi:hypothetical protein